MQLSKIVLTLLTAAFFINSGCTRHKQKSYLKETYKEIKKNFLKAKYLKKETIQLDKNEASLDWVVAKGLIYTLSDNNIIYLRQNMYIVVDTGSGNFILNLIVKNIVHKPIVYSSDLSEIIKVAKFELADDLGMCLN